jgi:hypothetical protein
MEQYWAYSVSSSFGTYASVWKRKSTIGDVNFPAEVIFETYCNDNRNAHLPTVIKDPIKNIRSIWRHTNVERKQLHGNYVCPYIYVVTYKISTAINPKIKAMFSTVLTDLNNLYCKKERYLNPWTHTAGSHHFVMISPFQRMVTTYSVQLSFRRKSPTKTRGERIILDVLVVGEGQMIFRNLDLYIPRSRITLERMDQYPP